MKNNRYLFTRAMALSLSIGACSSAWSGNTDTLVKGFADYQAGRVENIILDEFLYNLANQKYLIKFFPLTANSIKTYDAISGKRLIPVISAYYEKDLVSIHTMFTCIKQNTALLKNLNKQSISDIIKDENNKRKAEAKKQKKATADKEVTKADVQAAFQIFDILKKLKDNDTYSVADFNNEPACKNHSSSGTNSQAEHSNSTAPVSRESQPKHNNYFIDVADTNPDIPPNTSAAEAMPAQGDTEKAKAAAEEPPPAAQNYSPTPDDSSLFTRIFKEVDKIDQAINTKNWETLVNNLTNSEKMGIISYQVKIAKDIDLPGLIEAVNNIEGIDCGKEKDRNYAVCVHQLSTMMEALGFHIEDRKGFQKFKSASLFLASLSDAVDSDKNGNNGGKAVAAVIKDYVDEDEVYKNKRSPIAMFTSSKLKSTLRCNYFITCRDTLFIGSYYGVSFGRLDKYYNNEKVNVARAFGPLGVEYKFYSGRIKVPFLELYSKPSTVTLMYAPLDLGVYITSELNNEEYNVSMDDLRAPSVFVSITPIGTQKSLQLGCQNRVLVANKNKEHLCFVALSFDLPLFTIW